MHAQMSKALKAVALVLALSASTSFAASKTVMVAKADTAAAPKFVRQSAPAIAPVQAAEDSTSYLSLAEAEMIGMGYASFDAVLAEALNTPTAAGPQMVSTRALVEAVVAQRMGGLMP